MEIKNPHLQKTHQSLSTETQESSVELVPLPKQQTTQHIALEETTESLSLHIQATNETNDLRPQIWSKKDKWAWAIAAFIAILAIFIYGFLSYQLFQKQVFNGEPFKFFAFGNHARGLFSIGQYSYGIFSIGQFSVGIISIGQFSFGILNILSQFGFGVLFSLAQFSGGLGCAVGEIVISLYVQFGQIAIGIIQTKHVQWGVQLLWPLISRFHGPIVKLHRESVQAQSH